MSLETRDSYLLRSQLAGLARAGRILASVDTDSLDELPAWAQAILETARVAHLGLIDDRGHPRVLPVTFAVCDGRIYSAIDHKPKRRPEPARVRYLRQRPQAVLTVDRYHDDWRRLAWVQVLGKIGLYATKDRERALSSLKRKYVGYRPRPPQGPLLELVVERALFWRASTDC